MTTKKATKKRAQRKRSENKTPPPPPAVTPTPPTSSPTPEVPKTPPAPVNPVPSSRCRKCQSTNRSPYSNTVRNEISGAEPGTGNPFSAVIWRTTRCLDCGQVRRDKTYEYEPAT